MVPSMSRSSAATSEPPLRHPELGRRIAGPVEPVPQPHVAVPPALVLDEPVRDVEHVVAAVLLPWFFLTPVLYSLDNRTTPIWLQPQHQATRSRMPERPTLR